MTKLNKAEKKEKWGIREMEPYCSYCRSGTLHGHAPEEVSWYKFQKQQEDKRYAKIK